MTTTLIGHEGRNNGLSFRFETVVDSPYWNICLLALAWSWTLTTSTLLTTIGPLSAQELGISDSLAAFTIGIFLFGAAFSSVPSAFLFQRLGRLGGFSLGCSAQIVGSIMGALAMKFRFKLLLYVGCFSIGLGQGLGQFYRFAAVEICPVSFKSRAVTYVLSGGIIAAFLGPNCADRTVNFTGVSYVGSFSVMTIIGVINELTIMLVKFPPLPTPIPIETAAAKDNKTVNAHHVSPHELSHSAVRSSLEIISQPLFIVSCAVATLAHTIMVMLMSNVTLAMQDHGFSFGMCSIVMELHFFAMFSPGFFTGMLIKRFGTFIVAMLGAFIMAISIVILAIDAYEWNYIVGMILVGAGWNFSFSSGTVMLTSSYKVLLLLLLFCCCCFHCDLAYDNV